MNHAPDNFPALLEMTGEAITSPAGFLDCPTRANCVFACPC